MPSIDSLDFLNTNALRNYPIKEGVSRLSVDGLFTIPNSFIVDLQLAADPDPAARFFISRIANLEDLLVVEIADDNLVTVGSFSIVTANHWQYKDYYLTPTTAYAGAVGTMCITTLTTVKLQPSGIFDFTLATTELEPRTCVPALRGIQRITFKNSSGETYTVSGDVELEARLNLRFKQDSENANRIIIDAGEGLGLNTKCDDALRCIKTINGIPPDEAGNFTLDFSDCVTLSPIPAGTGLLMEDICCKPCVGCNDIEELTTRLMSAETGLLTLRNYYDSLNKLFTDFKTTVDFSCACPPED